MTHRARDEFLPRILRLHSKITLPENVQYDTLLGIRACMAQLDLLIQNSPTRNDGCNSAVVCGPVIASDGLTQRN